MVEQTTEARRGGNSMRERECLKEWPAIFVVEVDRVSHWGRFVKICTMRVHFMEKKSMRYAVLAALSCFALSGLAGEAPFPLGAPPKRASEPWRDKINAALLAKVDVDFKAKPADEAIQFLKEKSASNLIIDPKSIPAKWPAITHKQAGAALGDAMKAAFKTVNLDFSVRDGVIFVFDPKKVDMEFLKPEDMHIARMFEGRPERLDFQPKGDLAGDLLKQLTEPAAIKMTMDPQFQKVPITLDLKDVSLGHALRWLIRFSGGRVEVTRDGMNVGKR